MATEELGIRLRADGAVQTASGVDLAGQAAEKLGKKVDGASAALDKNAKSAKEVRAAYRLLPAQLTDVVTSLASGQQPWLVAIQQGGQIKDSFGGIGPTLRALTAAINPLTAGIFGLGTAGAVLTLAYAQGAAEAQAYTRAIVLTGNAAGTTSGRLGDMARNIDASVGTQGKAAEVLAQITSTGRVMASELQSAAETAIRLERVAGIAIEDTVKQFADLGRSPVAASVRLNETTNHLTLRLYEQIRALEKQGRTAEAAALAQRGYDDALKQRLPQIEAQLGLLQRGWLGVTGAAKEAWDAMLGLGREQTLQQQLEAVNQALAQPVQRGRNPLQADARREALRQRQAELQELQRLERRGAELQAAQAAATRAAIAEREKEKDKPKGPARADPLAEIRQRLEMARAELAVDDRLSQSERFRLRTLLDIDQVKGKTSQAALQAVRADTEQLARAMALKEAALAEAAARDELQRQFQAERDAATRAAYAEREQLEQRNATLAEETAVIELNAEALQARRQAQVDAEIADRAAHLARIDGLPAYAEEAAALQQQIELLRQRRELQQGKYVAEEAQKEREANDKRRTDLADSISEGVMEGFREGRSYADIFARELQAQFANLVLRPAVQMLVNDAWDGGSGGLIGGLISAVGGLFGGGRAGGGMAQRGRLFEVNEEGPEVISVGQRSYLMMGAQDGQVTPTGARSGGASGGGGGRSIVYSPTIHIDSRTDRAEVVALVQRANRQGQAQLLEMMERGQV